MANDVERAEFLARYWVESPEPIEKVAEVIAGEQSSGTFQIGRASCRERV